MSDPQTLSPPPRRSSGLRVLLGLTVVGVALTGAAGGAVWYVMNRVEGGDVDDHSYLYVDLSGEVPESPQAPGMFDDPEDAPPTIP